MGIRFSRPPVSGPDLTAHGTEIPKIAAEIAEFGTATVAALGPTGVGKTSLLNTVATYTGDGFTQQGAAGIGSKSLTPGITSHTLIIKEEKVKWNWIDTAGDTFNNLVEKWQCQSLPEEHEDYASPENYEQYMRENLLTPLQRLKVGCVVAVMSGKAIWHAAREAYPNKGHQDPLELPYECTEISQLKVIKHLHEKLAHEGMRMICILTNADRVHRDIKVDVLAVRHNWPIFRLRELVCRETGLPENQIYPVVNMVHDYRPQDNWPLGYLALLPVQGALRAARCANDQARTNGSTDVDGLDTWTEP